MKGSNCTESFILDQSHPNNFTRTFDVFIDPQNANQYYLTIQGSQTAVGTTIGPTGVRFGNFGPVMIGQEVTMPLGDTGALFGGGSTPWPPTSGQYLFFSATIRSLDRGNRYGDGVFEFLASNNANHDILILVVDGAFAMDADFKN